MAAKPRPTASTRHGARRPAGQLLLAVAVVLGLLVPLPRSASAETVADASAKTGVYLVWGSDSEAISMPYVRGGQVNVNWAQVEPMRGSYDWAGLDQQLSAYQQAGKPATVQVNSDQKPAWIYDYGIERCGTYTRAGATYDIPKYWDPGFHVLMEEMLRSLASHLRSSPHRSAVLGIRASPNLIGTEPYLLTDAGARPTAACATDWTIDKGNAAYERSMRLTYDAMMPDLRPILRASFFLSVNRDPAVRTELLGRDKAWMFGTNADPDRTLPNVDKLFQEWAKSGRTLGYYESRVPSTAHQLSWAYWRQLMDLGRGVSYIATYADDLRGATAGAPASSEYRSVFDFSNKYAGFGDQPAAAPGGWIAFRGGPDATDDNYGMFVTQLNADGTPGADATTLAVDSAAGANIVGPSDQRFGRFARRTELAGGKAKIYLRVAPEFKSTVTYGSRVSVTYLDQGSGTVDVRWGTTAGAHGTLAKTGTGRWQTASMDVPAAAMSGGLEATADLVVSVTGSDTTFHMVEVERHPGPTPSITTAVPRAGRGLVNLVATVVAQSGQSVALTTFAVDDAVIATDSVAPYEAAWDTTTVADGLHTIRATVTDSTGATASTTTTTTAVNHDLTPPSPAADLAGYAPTPTRVDLGWSPAADDVGLDGYQVRRNGDLLGRVEATSFIDRAAAAGTTYSYEVVAVDLAGNASPTSSVSITTPAPATGILLRASSSGYAYANRLTLAAPTASAGDVLIASVSARGSNVSITTPPGWNLIRRTDQAGYVNQVIFSRLAGTTEPPSYTWSMVGNHSVAGVIQSFAGVDGLNPVEASSGVGGSGDNLITAPGLTTIGTNRLLLGVYSATIADDIRPAPSMAEAAEVRSDIAARPPVTLEVAIETTGLAGATGSRTATFLTGTKPHVGQLLALKPKA